MKKTYLWLPLLALLFSSCFEDDGNYTYTDVDEITIEGIEDYYVKNSYNGEVLQITPTIKTSYTDLEYEWWLWDPREEENSGWDPTKEPYEAELIGTEKDLNYEVNCPLGEYTLMLKVISKSNGYFNTYVTKFDSQTLFTRGFYILKESADGNTELDLYNRDNELMTDLLTLTQGAPLEGKPRCLSTVVGHGNQVDNEFIRLHSVCVSTEANKVAFYETESFEKIHDENDVIVTPMDPTVDKPYMAFSYGFGNFFICSRGMYASFCTSLGMDITGQFPIPSTPQGGSIHVLNDASAGIPMVYHWSDTEHCIQYADSYSYAQDFFGPFNNNDFVTEDKDCLMCGACAPEGKGYFLLEDQTGKQYIYVISTGSAMITNSVEIDADSKLAHATEYAVNALTTNWLYFVYDNRVYVYDLTNFTERDTPLSLDGISADEEITYLSYQYQDFSNDTENNFTHLVVGTQQGDTYRLYMYNMTAGEPRELVRTIEGTGKMKMCAYMSSVDYDGGGIMSIPN